LAQTGQEILQKWDERSRHFQPRMEITREGLVLGAGTVLAKMAQDTRGERSLVLDDEPRAMALIATAFERPIGPYLLAKIGVRALERGQKGACQYSSGPCGVAALPRRTRFAPVCRRRTP
jgi:hypothetical protein